MIDPKVILGAGKVLVTIILVDAALNIFANQYSITGYGTPETFMRLIF